MAPDRIATGLPVRLAFLYIAEAYQLYHAAGVMFELMSREGIEVDVYYIDPVVPEHLERLCRAYGAPTIKPIYLPAGILGGLIQSVKLLGLAKPQVLAKNEERLRKYEAILSTEDGIVQLFAADDHRTRPARIVLSHGAGGRFVPSFKNLQKADLIVAKGAGDVKNLVSRGLAREGKVIAGGDQKLATSKLLAKKSGPLFSNGNPIVLYNPHKEPSQRSWDKFLGALIGGFRQDRSRNLIVAPHIKFFRRRSERVRQKLRDLSDDTILVDPGSFNSLDNTYTEAADIYVGDVSSQVVEFLDRPRPCVFLNAHNVDWQNDPHYSMWNMGEVVSHPKDVMDAIARAPELHRQFVEKQRDYARSALGDTSGASAIRTVDTILDFLAERRQGS